MENLKLCEIITSGDYGRMTDLTDNQRKFVTLHTEICRKGAYVVSGMVEFAEKLKEMRDGKSYVEAGFGSFGKYCEKAVGIKTSMAYRYVKVYEDLPKDFLYSNTKLGITKLSLLARLDKEEREELTGTVDVEKVSVEELRKAIEERDAKISQLELTASETESENAKKIKKSEDEEKYVDLITEPNLLELWAKKFHNCSYGYCDRIINGKCVIFLVRLKAFPEYPCCMFELETGSCRVVQARGRHNHKVSKYIEDFIYGFVDEMKLRVKYAEH